MPVFDRSSFQIGEKLFADIAAYIDDKYVDSQFVFNRSRRMESGESTILAETTVLQKHMLKKGILKMKINRMSFLFSSKKHLFEFLFERVEFRS